MALMEPGVKPAKVSLLGAAFDAPLMAVRARWPNTLHAVDMEHVIKGWERGTYDSVCGLTKLRLVGANYEGFQGIALWPPYARGLPKPLQRCHPCWVGTGRKRPRIRYSQKVDA